ncbi:hypothetical protein [Bifidobacterium avesanii]|uniref:Uncharacterized protein n=1 Tax=Bifidobacterium avesanii TaxID=1798157 RepID=A0A7K3TGA7_9BIFI|nr:hypothetical protein [Bifidobacterium avesanii]KAB8294582.1 hypothetical protein DSM100685_0375 [Bifidobacterium avesanii]NEG78092.1 hypothetical protein [Bifidobacterium avesanii]
MRGIADLFSAMRPTTRKFVGRAIAGVVAVSMIGAGVGFGVSAYAEDAKGVAGAAATPSGQIDAAR